MQATVILVVEEDLILRHSVMQALRAAGWNVLDAGSQVMALSSTPARRSGCMPMARCPRWTITAPVRWRLSYR